MNIQMLTALAISATVIGIAFWIVPTNSEVSGGGLPAPTAVIVDGTQIIDITAKGGYSPRVVVAKAGIPTVVRIATKDTFDCSASVVIPRLSYQKFLQPSGIEEIQITADQATGTLQGLCSMGMYNFKIKLEY